MMEVFGFFPLCTTGCSGRETKDHSGLIKSLMDLVLACLAKRPPVYSSVPVGENTIKYHPNGLTQTASVGTHGKLKKHFDRCCSTKGSQFLRYKNFTLKKKKYAQ